MTAYVLPDDSHVVPPIAQPALHTQGLTMQYPGKLALAGLNVALPEGITGIVGVNGAGKSTLIKIALGLLTPTSGQVHVLGLNPAVDGAAIRSRVGYMPEHDCLPPDVSAAVFVNHMARMSGLGKAAARERTDDVLRHVGLAEERYRPMGGYSTGMKQRAKLAQAIVHDPALVFLDEPTNGLDPLARDAMLELIATIGSQFGISLAITSHLLGELERIAKYVVVIDGGQLIRAGATAELTTRTGSVLIEVHGPPAADKKLGQALIDKGIQARPHGNFVEVDLVDENTTLQIRDTIVELGLGLNRIQRRRHELQEVFNVAPGQHGSIRPR